MSGAKRRKLRESRARYADGQRGALLINGVVRYIGPLETCEQRANRARRDGHTARVVTHERKPA